MPSLPCQPADGRPRLLVLVDVEEEFDWSLPFDRAQRSATHVPALRGAVEALAQRGLRTCGVITHPVLDDGAAVDTLRRLVEQDTFVPGAHLHPWVTPPFDEAVTAAHSFPCNLPPALEAAKLDSLTERIEQTLGQRPRIYQAGRYGVRPATLGLLADRGYQVDASQAPPFDYSAEGGPDFSRVSAVPSWAPTDPPVLCIPMTGALVGRAAALTRPLYRAASSPLLGPTRLPALLARTGLAERLRLSPEGHELADLKRLTSALLGKGCGVFTLSFHSPSLVPGHTSYVQSAEQARAFLARMLAYVDWMIGEHDALPSDPLALHAELLTAATPGT